MGKKFGTSFLGRVMDPLDLFGYRSEANADKARKQQLEDMAANTTVAANSPNMDDAAVQAARDAEKRKLRTSNLNDNTGGLLAADYGKPTVLGG
jgi:hypothetical protein